MEDDTTITPFHQPGSVIDPLTEIAREGVILPRLSGHPDRLSSQDRSVR